MITPVPLREPKASDFSLLLEGVGEWRFARRTLGDEIKIRQRLADICGSAIDDASARGIAIIIATVDVLAVKRPPGWDNLLELEAADPDDKSGKLVSVWEMLKERERTFRGQPKGESAPAGPGGGE